MGTAYAALAVGDAGYEGGKWAGGAAWEWFWGAPRGGAGIAPPPTNTFIPASPTPTPTPLSTPKGAAPGAAIAARPAGSRTPHPAASATPLSVAGLPFAASGPPPKVVQWIGKAYDGLQFVVFAPAWLVDKAVGVFFSYLPL